MSEGRPSDRSCEPLHARLTKESRKVHSVSDALVNTRLVALLCDRLLYARAIGCFYFVFARLERAFDAAAAAEPSKHTS